MVQVIERGPTPAMALGQGLQGALAMHLQQKQAEKKFQLEEQAKQGYLQQQFQQRQLLQQQQSALQQALQEQLQSQKMQQQTSLEEKKQANKIALEEKKSELRKGEKTVEEKTKKEQEAAPFKAGLETIQEMRKIRQKRNIGFGSQFTGIISPETRRDRAAYQTLGNSLISLASTIPIRNRAEFETLTGKLNDPSITLSEIDGVLDALENIINRSMQKFEPEEKRSEKTPSEVSKTTTSKPPLSSFYR